MKMFWNKLHFSRSFSVIAVTGSAIYGGRFHRKGKIWKMAGFAKAEIDPENPAAAWKKVARTAVLAEYRCITGKIPGASFFRFKSTDLPVSAQRGAVEFELPGHMLNVPEDCRTQFCVSGRLSDDPEAVMVNVAAFPGKSMEFLASEMRRAGVAADEFIYPFLAVDDELNSLALPEIEPDFAYLGESWMPMPDAEAVEKIRQDWLTKIAGHFRLPRKGDFAASEYLPVLLAAEVLVNKHANSTEALRVLPEAVRVVRFRGHLITTGILTASVIGVLIWRFMLTYGVDVKEYRQIKSEIKKIQQKTTELKSSLRRSSKEIKDMSRLVESRVGEPEAIAELAMFSATLPENVLVSSIRWGEKDIDVVVLCEDSNVDFDRVFRPLKYWKVSQQERQNPNQGVVTITLKLTPYEEGR